jgi:hypothetical protein
VKKSFSVLMGVGFVGFMALQGCAGADYTGDAEDVGSTESALDSSCISRQGTNASKAALAVAMGIELGRWDALADLEVVNGRTQLKAGRSCLNGSNCARTKAILGQQDFTADQNRFNNGSYQSDLSSSFDRQKNWIANLTQNHKDRLPPGHKLKMVGTVTLTGACGPHYLFEVDNADGSAMSTTAAQYMSNALCYFGQDAVGMSCGANKFVGFTQVQTGCPSGRVCVAIDPDDGDAGSGTTATAGSAPTYTLNRLWDPTNTKLNTACTKTSGPVGTMQSRCATYATTCGYLYCM